MYIIYFFIKLSKLGPLFSGCLIVGGNSIGVVVSPTSRSTTLWIDIHPHLILSHLDLYKYWANVSTHAMADDTKNERNTSVNIIIINWFNLYAILIYTTLASPILIDEFTPDEFVPTIAID